MVARWLQLVNAKNETIEVEGHQEEQEESRSSSARAKIKLDVIKARTEETFQPIQQADILL